jgi:acetolactate synthase I/II/III large subunit
MKTTGLDGGDAILDALRRLGVDYIISSPGSEWPPVWEALARQKREGTSGPVYIDCWHETLAVNMAMGYTNVTGRMQVVLLHAGAGLFQGALGIRTAEVSEIPMLVMSGESLTVGTDPDFDPGEQWYRSLSVVGGPQRMLEPIVKWASQVTSPHTLYEAVARAGEMAQRTPMGPIYLNVPLETMLAPWTPRGKKRSIPAAPKTHSSPRAIDSVVNLLLAAKEPVIATAGIGRNPDGVAALVELAELLGAPVIEGNSAIVANFPKDHPLHLGFDGAPLFKTADVILVVKERAPWYPLRSQPENATIVAIDDNPLKATMAYQELGADIYLEGDSVATLRSIVAALRAAGVTPATNHARRDRHSGEHAKLVSGLRKSEADAGKKAPLIDPLWLCGALVETMPANAVYVDETTVHRGLLKRHLMWNEPQSYFNHSGLGQGLGHALGIKLALPDRPVVSLIGDGAFLYNPVLPCLGASKTYELPILIVIFNNKRYQAMAKNHLAFYPDGVCATDDTWFGVHIDAPDLDEVGKSFGFYGQTVDDPEKLKAALTAALAAVQGGRTAIVNVMLSR